MDAYREMGRQLPEPKLKILSFSAMSTGFE